MVREAVGKSRLGRHADTLRSRVSAIDPGSLRTRFAAACALAAALPLVVDIAWRSAWQRYGASGQALAHQHSGAVALTQDIVVMLTLVGAAALFGALVAGRLTAPLGTLLKLVDALARGEADAPLPRSELTEVKQMVQAFGYLRYRLAVRTEERRHAVRELRASESRFRALIESSSDAITLVAADGSFRYTSPASTRILGHPAAELLQARFLDLLHPDDLPYAQVNFAALIDQRQTRFSAQLRCRRGDGSYGWVEATATNLLAEPSVCAVVVTLRDVNEQRQADEALRESEVRFRNVAQSAADAIISVTTNGTIVFWNSGAEAIFGYCEEQMFGQPVELVVPERYRGRPMEEFFGIDEHTGHGLPGHTQEMHGLRADGTEFPFEMSAASWTTGGKSYFTGIVRDVSERRRAEDALRAANAELEQFAYTVSHDLKSPLVSIQGFASRLATNYAGALDEAGFHCLQRITANAAYLGEMIDGVLRFSRIGRSGGAAKPVDLNEAVRQTLERRQIEIERRGAVVDVHARLPVVEASPVLIEQVLENLVTNALTYGAVSGAVPQIEIGCHDLGARWSLFVRDEGPGIAPEHAERLFRLFERLPAGKAVNPQGTGVGLATVRKAAEAMGGAAGVESALGQGANFWVTIPKAQIGAFQSEHSRPREAMLV